MSSSVPTVNGRPLTWAYDTAGTLYMAILMGHTDELLRLMFRRALMLDAQAMAAQLEREHPQEFAAIKAEFKRLRAEAGGPSCE